MCLSEILLCVACKTDMSRNVTTVFAIGAVTNPESHALVCHCTQFSVFFIASYCQNSLIRQSALTDCQSVIGNRHPENLRPVRRLDAVEVQPPDTLLRYQL